MSVKFEKETVRTAQVPGVRGAKEDTMHKIGEAVTGGKSQTGYLAVCALAGQRIYRHGVNGLLGISKATSIQSSTNEDAHLWYSRRPTRGLGIVACP
jgi:hypothetical protein